MATSLSLPFEEAFFIQIFVIVATINGRAESHPSDTAAARLLEEIEMEADRYDSAHQAYEQIDELIKSFNKLLVGMGVDVGSQQNTGRHARQLIHEAGVILT